MPTGCLCSYSDAVSVEGQAESDAFFNYLQMTQDLLDERRRNGDKRVKIAIIDSGVDTTHPYVDKLAKEAKSWKRLRVQSFVDSVPSGQDHLGHGTHIAVTVMRIAQWAEICVATVVDAEGKVDPISVAKALNHSINEWQVNIISMSLGFGIGILNIEKELKEADRKDVLVFAAVSNFGAAALRQISWPASMTKVFGINSANLDGVTSSFNPPEDDNDSFSRYKFLGERVRSAWPIHRKEGEEKALTGTSIATPIAAATAALFMEFMRQNLDGSDDVAVDAQIIETPDGMKEIFKLIGKRKSNAEYLLYVTPWHLLHTEDGRKAADSRKDILGLIHHSLRTLRVVKVDEQHKTRDTSDIQNGLLFAKKGVTRNPPESHTEKSKASLGMQSSRGDDGKPADRVDLSQGSKIEAYSKTKVKYPTPDAIDPKLMETWVAELKQMGIKDESIRDNEGFIVDFIKQQQAAQTSSSLGGGLESGRTPYSNHAQPYTSTLPSQLPEQNVAHSQEAKSHTMDKKSERGILEEIFALKGHTKMVWAVAFSPDGKQLASASKDQTVRLWNTGSGAPLRTLKEHTGQVYAVAFSPDGKQLASASNDQTVRLWDADSGAPLRVLKGHTSGVCAVVFSPDSKKLASASVDQTVRLWDAGSGAPLRKLKGHTDTTWAVAFSPDGKQLASASWDHTIRLWDTGSGAPLHTLKGHTKQVYDVAFSPNGKRLASASIDQTVRLWDAGSGAPLFEGDASASYAVAFSSDGKQLATGSADNIVRLWDAG